MQLTLEISETVAEKLARVAARDEKAVEQVAAERLAASLDDVHDLPERYAELLRILESPPHFTEEDRLALEEAMSEKSPPSPDENIFGE